MRTSLRHHHVPTGLLDRVMLGTARSIHALSDRWFGVRRTHRMLVLEALAGIPSTVLAMQHHLRALRQRKDDRAVRRSVVQADREHAHLLVFSALVTPTAFERVLLALGQAVLLTAFVLLTLVSERAAHRLAGYFEEEAIASYDDYARALERGTVENARLPAWVTTRWGLEDGASIAALVRGLQDEEAEHRDEHHAAADALAGGARRSDERGAASPKRSTAP